MSISWFVGKRIGIVVPVSVYEPAETLYSCANHLKKLDFGDHEIVVVFSFDGEENDKRALMLREMGFDVIARKTNRGKRAGAVNDAVTYLKKFKPDLVAILDVDSRPEKDVILRCAEKLDRFSFIASSKRRISNPVNPITKAVELEYRFLGFLLEKSHFRQFNGLIGVLRYDLIDRYRLNEKALTEDADFSTRMHLHGFEAKLSEGYFFEQAPLNAYELYKQRKRWYYGGLELWKYSDDVLRSGNVKFAVSWLLALTLTYFPLIFIPLLLFSLPALIAYYGKEGFERFAGILAYAIVLQSASISAIFNFLRRKQVEWKAVKRMEQLRK